MSKQAAAFLDYIQNRSGKIVILTHQNADFDAIGSALSLTTLLNQNGFNSVIFYPDALAESMQFLAGLSDIVTICPPLGESDTLIALDCSNPSRIAGYSALLGPIHINIDHHSDNPSFGQFNIVESISSVGELLFTIFNQLNWQISRSVANALYAAIIFDTGLFQHDTVSSQTFRIAATLKDLGADTHQVSQAIFASKPFAYFVDLKESLKHLTFLEKERISYTICDQKSLESAGDIMTLLQTQKESDIFLVFKEESAVLTRVSLRSNSTFNVAAFAKKFGGGGHPQAAGLSISDCITNSVPLVLNSLIQEKSK